MTAPVIDPVVDVDASISVIEDQRKRWKQARIARPMVRIWDGDWNLFGFVSGELKAGFRLVENETGQAYIRLSVRHYIAKWIADHRGRDKKNVHVTFDKQGVRWGGRLENYKLVKEKGGVVYLEATFKHDYEEVKHVRCWSSPFLPAEIQFPKVWMCFGPAKWALSVTLLVNIMRLESSIWMLPDDPMDRSQWFDFDQSNWSIVVKPFEFAGDSSVFTTVFSRFRSWHELAQRALEDAQLSVRCTRYLEGDPPPWPGANLRHGCLVIEIVDKSGWNTETGFFGSLLTGLQRAFTQVGSDGMTEGVNLVPNPNYPPQYYEPGYKGTLPKAPWVVFMEGPHTGIKSSEFTWYPATDVQVVVGGHSAPMVNEMIGAAIIAIGGFIGSLFGQSQIGSAVEAVLRPLYTDVLLAFQTWKDVDRAQDLGWSHYHEKWGDGADKAYTIAALIALRAGMWSTRERTVHTLEIADAAPYYFGGPGQGDMELGDRIATTVLGAPDPHWLYVERIMAAEYSWDPSGPSGWVLEIGQREPEDPVLRAMQIIQEINGGLQQLGVL